MLVTPPWYFANVTDNYTGTPANNQAGTSVTVGASNADGATATLLTALGHDVHYIVVGINGATSSGRAQYTLLDILQDPAGGTAWASLIDDLVCGYTLIFLNTVVGMMWYHFPVFVKSGSSIGARARTSISTGIGNARVFISAFGNPSRPEMWWCGQGVETLGVTAASSVGTSLTPGNTGSYGSWTNIGGTTNAPYGAIQCGTNGTDASAAALAYYFQVGYSSTQLPGSPTMGQVYTTAEDGMISRPNAPIWCDIPSGTQMQMRATCSGTAEIWAGGVAIYGVY